jgi:retinol dehydrogenase 14
VSTSFGAEDPSGVQRLLVPFMRPFMKSPAAGAATSVHLASSPDLEAVTGRYFANGKSKNSSKRSHDEADAARLWRVSADLVGECLRRGAVVRERRHDGNGAHQVDSPIA